MTAWSNWARNVRATPVRIAQPRSGADVAEILGDAAARGLHARAVGSGHSFTACAATDGVLIDISALDQVLDADPATGLVRAQAGITIRQLARQLHARGLALANQGDVDPQTIAGAIATGTHGTGATLGNISSCVVAMKVALPSGEILDTAAGGVDPDVLRALRVSIGALGVIVEVTLQCVPAYRIHRVDSPEPFRAAIDAFEERALAHDHYELFGFPHTDKALTFTSERTQAPAKPPSRLSAFIEDEVIGNGVFGALVALGRRAPALSPRIAQVVGGVLSESEHLDDSFRIFAHPRRVRFLEMEYAIPRAAAAPAAHAVLDLIERERIPVIFPIELRCAAADDALLSTAEGRDTAYVAVHQRIGAPHEPFFRAVEEIMDRYDGRPHWGKMHFQTAATLAPRYPQWDRFAAIRAQLDPTGVCANAYTDRVLGPVSP